MNIKNALLKNKNKALLISEMPDYSQDILLNAVAEKLNNGIKIIHFYIKSISDKDNIETGLKLRQLCSIYNALFIVNSRIDIAQIAQAEGICLYDNDLTISQIKKCTHDDILIARYSNNLELLLKNTNEIPDYICYQKDEKLPKNIDIKLVELDRLIL